MEIEFANYYLLNGRRVWVSDLRDGKVYFERCDGSAKAGVLEFVEFEDRAVAE